MSYLNQMLCVGYCWYWCGSEIDESRRYS